MSDRQLTKDPSERKIRRHADFAEPGITEKTYARLVTLLELRYPGKVRRVVEVCPVAVVKIIDNEADAVVTIENLERHFAAPEAP